MERQGIPPAVLFVVGPALAKLDGQVALSFPRFLIQLYPHGFQFLFQSVFIFLDELGTRRLTLRAVRLIQDHVNPSYGVKFTQLAEQLQARWSYSVDIITPGRCDCDGKSAVMIGESRLQFDRSWGATGTGGEKPTLARCEELAQRKIE